MWGFLSGGAVPAPVAPTVPVPKTQERFLWMHMGSGADQVGRPVNINGRTGRVVDGTELTILVEWD